MVGGAAQLLSLGIIRAMKRSDIFGWAGSLVVLGFGALGAIFNNDSEIVAVLVKVLFFPLFLIWKPVFLALGVQGDGALGLAFLTIPSGILYLL